MLFALTLCPLSCTKTEDTPAEPFPASIYLYELKRWEASFKGHLDLPDSEIPFAKVYLYYSYLGRINVNESEVRSTSEFDENNNFDIYISGLSFDTRYVYLVVVEVRNKKYYSDLREFTTLKENKYDYQSYNTVDLGLSVKWAVRNMGAIEPEESGDYYAWGDVENKSDFSWSNYTWCHGSSNSLTKYCTNSNFGNDGFSDNKTILEVEDDVASAKLGRKWRTPTSAEWRELLEKCIWTWTDNYKSKGVKGYVVTSEIPGYTNRSIFLPAAGCYDGENLSEKGTAGYYWSSFLNADDPSKADCLYIQSDKALRSGVARSQGLPIRPVTE